MNRRDAFERLLVSLQDAAFDEGLFPAASRLIDEACGVTGNSLIVGAGAGDSARLSFAVFYRRGERRQDLERDYYRNYFQQDERVPRIARLRHNRLVRAAGLFRDRELKSSATWNEALPQSGTQNGLTALLRDARGSGMVWVIADPVAGEWESGRIRTIRRLFPHIANFVSVRKALAAAKASGSSLLDLLDNDRIGVIRLNWSGRFVEANDRARHLLGQEGGLRQQDGFLRAWLPDEDARLQQLLAAALPPPGAQAAGGSMLVRHPRLAARLTLDVHPVTARQMDLGALGVGALVLIAGTGLHTRLDAALVGSELGLSSAESHVAVWLAEGKTVRDIAVASGRAETSIRTYVRRIHHKLGVSRRAELVRLVLSVPGRAALPQRP